MNKQPYLTTITKEHVHYYFTTREKALSFIDKLDKNFIFRKDNFMNDYEVQVKKEAKTK